jgi:hypothetical protein
MGLINLTVACPLPTSRLRQVRRLVKAAYIMRTKADLSYFHTGGVTDVVKTRLQVEARKGQTSYKGLADAFTKICK